MEAVRAREGTGRGPPRVVLASTSPRRRQLLTDHGIEHEAIGPGVDDADLEPGEVEPKYWVAALAYLKSAAGRRRVDAEGERDGRADRRIVIGADTVVVKDGEIVGQPRDGREAGAMIRKLRGGEHEVYTGVSLVESGTGRRCFFFDRARVRVGPIADDRVDAYAAGGGWRGKAGGYNLSERLRDGWPIEHDGDPTTIMGLPMGMLPRRLERFAAGAPCGEEGPARP